MCLSLRANLCCAGLLQAIWVRDSLTVDDNVVVTESAVPFLQVEGFYQHMNIFDREANTARVLSSTGDQQRAVRVAFNPVRRICCFGGRKRVIVPGSAGWGWKESGRSAGSL